MLSNEQDNTAFLAPNVHQEKRNLCTKLSLFDVFAFVPVPVFSPGKHSSFRSLCFSIILFFVMVIYAITTLYGFIHNNVPKTSQQNHSIDNKSFDMPEIAMTFIPDMSYGVSIVDKSYYSVSISQGVLYKGLYKKREEEILGTNYKCEPDWLPKMNFSSFLCPEKMGVLEGNLFTSDEFKFIKVDFLTCKNGTDPNVVCQSQETINKILSQGRFFLFINHDDDFYGSEVNGFKALFYHPHLDYNQKYEIYLENKISKKDPDYFHSFKSQKKTALFYKKEKTYFSSLVPGQENVLLTVWLRLNEEESQQNLQPSTIMEVLGHWGALWSVLLTTLGLYFWKFNRNSFYKKNPNWENFGTFTKTKKDIYQNDTSMVL